MSLEGFSIDYFEKNIKHKKKRISGGINLVSTLDINNTHHFNMITLEQAGFAVTQINLLVAMYSAEYDKWELKKELERAISYIDQYWEPDVVRMSTGTGARKKYYPIYYLSYTITMRWVLSLAVLLDCEVEQFNLLKSIIDRDKIKDKIFDILLSSKEPNRPISEEINPKKPANNLVEILRIENPKLLEDELISYLRSDWLKTYRKSGIYNSHKAADRIPFVFNGYWAFEVAAIVKVLNLNVAKFKEIPFFPNRFF